MFEKIKLKNLVDLRAGIGFPNKYQGNKNGNIPFYKVGDISREFQKGNFYIDDADNYVTDEILTDLKGKLFEEGTIIFAKVGEALKLNRRIILTKKAMIDNNIFGIKSNNSRLNNKYLFYFLLHYDLGNICKTGAVPSVNQSDIYSISIPLPSTSEEQQEIVDVLDAASEIIRLRTACIESAQSLIPALFQEMFGDMTKNTNNYELFKIKDLGKVTTGSTPSSKKENMFGGTTPFITPADLESGQDKYSRYVTPEGAQNSRIVRTGSTLVCCIGATIGKVDRAIVDSCFNQQINAIEWNENINDIFGLYLFRQIAPLIRNKASHTTLPILNKGNFENIIIPKPPKPKQELFAAKAQEIEEYIKTQQAELDNAKTMFQSLLHQAFTGKLTENITFEAENE